MEGRTRKNISNVEGLIVAKRSSILERALQEK